MKDEKTLGILLKKIMLANDDALLEFFTDQWGTIVILAPKFSKSKKRAEIDFFRLLELNIFQGRKSKRLKEAQTLTLFPGFTKSYEASEQGYEWLQRIKKNFPEEKSASQDFFKELVQIFHHYEEETSLLLDVFLRLKLLNTSGLIPRFDQVRGDTYFDPIKGQFFETAPPATIFLPNLTRQMLEFFRRSNLAELLAKQDKLPLDDLPDLQNLMEQIENYHQG